ncbi:MAG: TolC family protein [Elusimicrobiota bacterium]|jgi:outer membrane protein TolC
MSSFIRIHVSVLAAVLLASGAKAAESSTPPLALREVLESVRRDNPALQAARLRWEAALKRVAAAATPDQPRLELERMYAPSGADPFSGADEKAFSVRQEIPFPSTLYLRHGAAARDAAIEEQRWRGTLIELLARARSAYAALFLADRSLAIYDENISVMRRFAKVSESKLAAGRGRQADALKAQVELTRLLNMRETLTAERESSSAALAALMGREDPARLGPVQEPAAPALAASLEDLEAALSGQPALKGAALGVERARTELALARSEFLPDLMFQYRRRSDPLRGRTHDAVLGLSLPLWFWKPASLAAEAKARQAASEAELRAARLGARADLRTAWARVETARRLLDAYRGALLPQAEESLNVAETGYGSDRLGFLDLLDAQRSLLGYRLEYCQVQAEYEQRLADLEIAAGKEL